MQTGARRRSVLTGIAIIVAASLLGLVGLPLVFGSLPDPSAPRVWLVLAVLDCVGLLLPTRTLADALGTLLVRLPGRGRASASTQLASAEVARLLVAAGYLLVLQAILRHPLVAVLGADAGPFLVEAAFGILALLVLLLLLTWIYRAARPLVEGMAWVALDAAFATSSIGEASQAASTITPSTASVTPTLSAGPTPEDPTVTRLLPTETVARETRPDATQLSH